ncbi:hypothetical protein [uncultured Sphingomonas sp.]|uniref:hypothetical protein n=1 Tax=uncultured Sphingomonas sp. TaxID=158754 RepID=UPI00263272D5|nr:hypothetical protein [uncultured Sphingomonas sp.]
MRLLLRAEAEAEARRRCEAAAGVHQRRAGAVHLHPEAAVHCTRAMRRGRRRRGRRRGRRRADFAHGAGTIDQEAGMQLTLIIAALDEHGVADADRALPLAPGVDQRAAAVVLHHEAVAIDLRHAALHGH